MNLAEERIGLLEVKLFFSIIAEVLDDCLWA